MNYSSNVDTIFLYKKESGCTISYRLFHSESENGGYFLLISSEDKHKTADIFVPFISPSGKEAIKITNFLFENSVTPCTALEVLDEYLGKI